MKKFHIGAIACGLGLLIFLIWKIGVAALWRDMILLGWGFIPFLLIEGVAKFFHAIGWRCCLSGPYRSMPFLHILGIDLAGNSINYFTPTATIGGEFVKGSLLYARHKGPEAITGVIIGKITYTITQLLFATLGSMVFVWKIPLSAAGYIAVYSVNALIAAGIFAFVLIQKHGKLGTLVRWFVARGIGGKTFLKAVDEITKVDHALQLFYRDHPARLLYSIFWHTVAMAFKILKTWYFLVLMSSGGSLFMAAGVWFLGTWLDILTFPVPLEIGLLESIRVLVFKALGFGMDLGLTFGIALRLEQLFLGGIGLIIYAGLFSEERGKGLLAKEVTVK